MESFSCGGKKGMGEGVTRLSQELDEALAGDGMAGGQAPDDGGLIVKLARLRHEDYPGRGAIGILPLFVVGHEAMPATEWQEWVRETGFAHYGSAYAEKMAKQGVDLKEMLPTAPFGREMRLGEKAESFAGEWSWLDQAGHLIEMIDKWPQLYNLLADNIEEEEMTLREFINRAYRLPSPRDVGEGRFSTLGDIIGRGVMVLPHW